MIDIEECITSVDNWSALLDETIWYLRAKLLMSTEQPIHDSEYRDQIEFQSGARRGMGGRKSHVRKANP